MLKFIKKLHVKAIRRLRNIHAIKRAREQQSLIDDSIEMLSKLKVVKLDEIDLEDLRDAQAIIAIVYEEYRN